MKRLPLALLAFCFAALAAALAQEPGGIRVVSQTVGGDEALLALAEPSQIAALSHLATDPDYSAVVTEAAGFPLLTAGGDAESILRHRPTLVVFADYSRPELVAQVRRAGVHVLVFTRYATLADACENLHQLARELGPAAQAKAARITADCEKRVADLHSKLRDAKPVRVIAPSTYGVIAGRDTTFQDLCDHAAAENLAATLGHLTGHAPPPSERILTWPVDFIVLSGPSLDHALAIYRRLPPYQLMSAVRENRAVLLRPHLLGCVSHRRVDGYEELARALHPKVFK